MVDRYFKWLLERVDDGKHNPDSYVKLLRLLHTTTFEWHIERDINRAADGKNLRYTYEYMTHRTCEFSGDCTVLEMMVALACRMESDIMDNPEFGNRTGQWFWAMINNLGLIRMTNSRFNEAKCKEILHDFMAPGDQKTTEIDLFYCSTFSFQKWNNMEIWQKMTAWLNENYNF